MGGYGFRLSRYSEGREKMKNNFLAHRIFSALLIGGIFVNGSVFALPQGGTIVGGSSGDTIEGSGNVMNITGSGNMVIKWEQFGIGRGESVNFNGMANALNYVTGNAKSEIYGALNGSGVNVFLINPNGILFGAGSQVNVGSLYTSTARLDQNRLDGFNGTAASLAASASGTADIINLGTVTASSMTVDAGSGRVVFGTDALAALGNGTDMQNNLTVTAKHFVIDQAVSGTDTVQGNAARHYAGNSNKTYTNITVNGRAGQSIKTAFAVDNIYDLQNISTNLSGNYYLTGNIEAGVTAGWNSGAGFMPLGYDPDDGGTAFTGTFDGLEHTITGLSIDRGAYVGLFGYTSGSTVCNVGLVDGSIRGAVNAVGSLVGWNSGGEINNVYNTGTVNGANYVGGIIGYNDGGKVGTVYNTGSVTGAGHSAGGIIGSNKGNGAVINNAYNTGKITGSDSIGGIAGGNKGGTVSNVYNTGTINGGGYEIGGIVGSNEGSTAAISNAYNTGSVSGDEAVGGIAGYNDGGRISEVYNTSGVTGNDYTGIMVGDPGSGTVNNAYYATTDKDGNTINAGIDVFGAATGTSNNVKGYTLTQLQSNSDGKYDSWSGFNDNWRIYEGHTMPLLKSFMTDLTITINGDQTVVYNEAGNIVDLDKLGYDLAGIDTDKILGTKVNGIGVYDIAELLYSNQHGYNITINGSGQLIVREASAPGPDPGPDYQTGNDVIYQSGQRYLQQSTTADMNAAKNTRWEKDEQAARLHITKESLRLE
jgi:filamentous hemagglutinin family protein